MTFDEIKKGWLGMSSLASDFTHAVTIFFNLRPHHILLFLPNKFLWRIFCPLQIYLTTFLIVTIMNIFLIFLIVTPLLHSKFISKYQATKEMNHHHSSFYAHALLGIHADCLICSSSLVSTPLQALPSASRDLWNMWGQQNIVIASSRNYAPNFFLLYY